jgi:DNA-binding GntR family transcriptional regulator
VRINGSRAVKIRAIVEFIKAEIASGNLKSGDKVPSGLELCRLFKATTNNVCDARKILVDEGILGVLSKPTREKEAGTWVI